MQELTEPTPLPFPVPFQPVGPAAFPGHDLSEETDRHVGTALDVVSAVQPRLSIVVPTRDEKDNVAPLVARLNGVCPEVPMEIIFVDDSTDETPQAIEAAREHSSRPIHMIHREGEDRVGGLGGAVVAGMRAARAPWVCVIDADLQHPPEVIEQMLAKADTDTLDVVVASRYRENGEAASFGRMRSLVSKGSTVSARMAFPRRLRGVTDPMSGFFMLRRNSVELANLHPHGFKILLEILGRSRNLRVGEVPFAFGTRHAGESKASLREGLRYAQLLMDLRVSASTLRFMCFVLVGVSGLLVNSLALAVDTELFGTYYVVAALIATQASTLWNFLLTDRWVYRAKKHTQAIGQRASMFFVMNNIALVIRIPVLYTLTTVLGMHYLASNLISLAALTVVRYATADRFIWGDGLTFLQRRRAAAPARVASSLNDGAL